MKNVLMIMDYAAPYKGNFIPSIQNLEKHIVQAEGRMIYLFPLSAKKFEWIKELQSEGKTIYFIDNSFFSKRIKYSNIKKLMNIVKSENVSIIHTNFVAYNYSLFLIKNIFIRKIKIVGQFQNHFLPPFNRYRKFKIFITKYTYDKIIGVSDSVEQSVLNALIPPKKVTRVFNSLAGSRLNNYENISLKNKSGEKVVLMFGWPFSRKGGDIALDVIKQLNHEGRDTILVISTSGGKSIIEDEIKNILGELPHWVKILDPREDVATYYNAADIFISPSREEGYTFAVLEAAYCNCMIIVSAIGGNPQDIPFTGIFNLDDKQKFKELIIKFFDKSEPELKQINKMQREYVLNKYDIDNWSKEIIKIYLSLEK